MTHDRPIQMRTDDSVVRRGIGEATDSFLQKPFTAQSLARKVRAVLDGPA